MPVPILAFFLALPQGFVMTSRIQKQVPTAKGLSIQMVVVSCLFCVSNTSVRLDLMLIWKINSRPDRFIINLETLALSRLLAMSEQ